jgi:hypothetical protein
MMNSPIGLPDNSVLAPARFNVSPRPAGESLRTMV